MDELHSQPSLSRAGQHRREAILRDALRELGRARRRHVRRNLAIAIIAPTAIAGLLFALARPRSQPPAIARPMPAPVAPVHAPDRDEAKPPRPVQTVVADAHAVIRILGDDPHLRERLRMPTATGGVGRIDDDQLLRTLVDSGLQGGLATVGGTTTLYVGGQAVR